mmetsp:Transcript_6770/g.14814  ORF Transcript_6770/g.14814 Transcript_6770/m.14814 type:complete len:232 (-) Transcript_6770:319-1014(-)
MGRLLAASADCARVGDGAATVETREHATAEPSLRDGRGAALGDRRALGEAAGGDGGGDKGWERRGGHGREVRVLLAADEARRGKQARQRRAERARGREACREHAVERGAPCGRRVLRHVCKRCLGNRLVLHEEAHHETKADGGVDALNEAKGESAERADGRARNEQRAAAVHVGECARPAARDELAEREGRLDRPNEGANFGSRQLEQRGAHWGKDRYIRLKSDRRAHDTA